MNKSNFQKEILKQTQGKMKLSVKPLRTRLEALRGSPTSRLDQVVIGNQDLKIDSRGTEPLKQKNTNIFSKYMKVQEP